MTGVWRNTTAGWTQWWDGVQRAWRDTPLMRAVVGYQRLNELPPPPKPIQWLLDEKLLPAYFGEGLQALVGRIEVLPTVGDIILERCSCRPLWQLRALLQAHPPPRRQGHTRRGCGLSRRPGASRARGTPPPREPPGGEVALARTVLGQCL